MTKDLRKQIMLRSKLRNIFDKNRNYENWCTYKCQLNNYFINITKILSLKTNAKLV